MGSSSPIFGMKIRNIWNHHLVFICNSTVFVSCPRDASGHQSSPQRTFTILIPFKLPLPSSRNSCNFPVSRCLFTAVFGWEEPHTKNWSTKKIRPSINLRQWLPLFRHFWINLQYPLIRARKKIWTKRSLLKQVCGYHVFPRLNGKNRNRNTRPWSERHILLGSQFIIFHKKWLFKWPECSVHHKLR